MGENANANSEKRRQWKEDARLILPRERGTKEGKTCLRIYSPVSKQHLDIQTEEL